MTLLPSPISQFARGGVVAVTLGLAVIASACGTPAPHGATANASPSESPGTTHAASGTGGSGGVGSATSAPTTTERVPFDATTTTMAVSLPITAAPCPPATTTSTALPGNGDPARTTAIEQLTPALASLTAAGGQVGVSVSVDGWGEIVSQRRDEALVPASNQKLLIAMAALEGLPADDHLRTTVVATGPTVDGVLRGDLVLVGGGDPLLTRTAAQSLDSLDTLITQLHAAGLQRVEGRVLVDETRYDGARVAPGWPQTGQSYVGPLSALTVDRNRVGSDDPAFFTDPALVHARSFRTALETSGISVTGGTETGAAPAGQELASIASASIRELVVQMLSTSDNLIAEMLTKELGRRRRGEGSTAVGLVVAREIADALCVRLDGRDADGSGLSSNDAHSAGTWRRLLEVAKTRPWWPALRDGLPLAGRSGTLATRLTQAPAAGNVRAKTGSIGVARSLSGYLKTAGGRDVVFSIVVNAPTPNAEKAIDAFVLSLAELA